MFASITVSMWALVYTVTYEANVGALPITILPTNSADDPNKLFYIDFQFYNKIYMQPYYWIGIYCFGILFGSGFYNYQLNKNASEPQPMTEFLNNLIIKPKNRAILYAIAVFLTIGGVLRQKRMVEKPENQPRWGNALWATLGNTGFCLGVALLVMLMLVGRCRPLLVILDCDCWQSLSKLIACMNMLSPIACLWFFLSTSSQLNYAFLSQLYYF